MRCTPPNGFPYLIDLMDYVDAKLFGTSDAIDKVKSDENRKDTMHTWQIKRKAHQGPCLCDDCGKHMEWRGIDWCITNNGYLLCSSCMLTWVRENRYHKETREKSTPLRKLAAAA